MKVLLVSGTFPPMKCGVGDYTAALASALAKRGDVSVGVLTSVGASDPGEPGVQILPVVHRWKLSETPRIVGVMRSWRPDIVHVQYPTPVYGEIQWLLPTIARALARAVVQTWHEYHPQGNILNLPNAILPGGLVVVRPNFRERMPSWYRLALVFKKFRYIPNASCIPAVLVPDANRAEALSAWEIPSGNTVAYFGFVSPAKGVDLLFRIADPEEHRLLLICDLDPSDPYQKSILEKTEQPPWKGKVRVTGFLSADDVGRLLAAVDAAVFPFLDGGGDWNTTIHGATAQGTFVLTTSRDRNGYCSKDNVYYARPGDIEEMGSALKSLAGRRTAPKTPSHDWEVIADRHVQLYENLVS